MSGPGLTNRTDLLLTTINNNILPVITEIAGTFSYDETSVAEQTIETIVITEKSVINAFWLDLSNVTQNSTLRLYHEIDGSTLRLFQENNWITTDDDGVLIAGFTPNDNIRLTIQCSGAGAGAVNIPYSVL